MQTYTTLKLQRSLSYPLTLSQGSISQGPLVANITIVGTTGSYF
ncbi:hypothetical protein HanXRQr2_Chr06g0243971 [Helianthus annuus]|uniref:Uncharacterized protein n=1 Tax=Helianthus annuus TaxID=4232 RepID=A0A9K3NI51_HELAN|nr:hypothetical protein HanXRQr2_Chr06g0243971 [Helianthus annuus]KAJ0565389.1 hypothetical protein HanIR_Chr06g0262101 [Helianthus annuus]